MWFRAKHDSAHLIQNAFVMFSHRVNEEENYIIKIHFFLIIWCSAMIDKSAVGLGVSGRGCIAILTYVSLGVWWVCFFEWNILPLPLNYRMGVVMIQLKSLLLSRDAPHHHQWRSSQSSYAECNSHDFRQRPIVHFFDIEIMLVFRGSIKQVESTFPARVWVFRKRMYRWFFYQIKRLEGFFGTCVDAEGILRRVAFSKIIETKYLSNTAETFLSGLIDIAQWSGGTGVGRSSHFQSISFVCWRRKT